jgi:TetR/AcrR family transcriptional regulator, cholesterol catabolism regulator
VRPRVPVPPPTTDTLSAAQLDRRRRVLDAVIELVSQGRLEDMSMKDVAERSGVALGTIYRYFSSKDHVAAAALAAWAQSLDGRTPVGAPADGDSPADRLVAILREPNFARLLMLAATSSDPFASECYREMGDEVFATLGSALADLDADERRRVLDVVGAVLYASLVEWVSDRKHIGQVHAAVESAAHLVLAGYEGRP